MTTQRRGRRSFILLVGASIGLVSCGVSPPRLTPAPIDPVERALMDAAAIVEDAWQTQNAVLLASNPAPSRSSPPPRRPTNDAAGPVPTSARSTAALDDPADMIWQGMLAPAVRQLAHKIDYRFREVGASPTPPILVSLNYVHTPVLQILRSAGIQAGLRADVVVREDERTLEVVYHRGPPS